MEIAELKEWLKGNITEKERLLKKILASNIGSPFPDIVARRVVETEIMIYRIVLRKIGEDGD